MMEAEPNRRIDQFNNVTVENKELVEPIMAATREAEVIVRDAKRSGFTDDQVSRLTEVRQAVANVNAILAQSAARCRIDPPPPADIEMVTDESGYLMLRCKHRTPHAWRLDGTPR